MLKTYHLINVQTDIWLGQKINPESIQFVIGGYIDLKGDLAFDLFCKALNATINREHVFNTRFYEEDEKVQQYFLPENTAFRPVELICHDKSDPSTSVEWMKEDLKIPLDFINAELYKFSLIRVDPQSHYFYFKIHHVISDFYGISIFIEKLLAGYNDHLRSNGLTAPDKYKYTDYLDKIAAYKGSDQFSTDEQFWKANLSKLTTDPGSLFTTNHNRVYNKEMTQLSVVLDLEEYENIKSFLSVHDVSILHIVLASLYTYLSAIYNRTDLIITTPVHNRIDKASKKTVGMFINIIPVVFDYIETYTFLNLIKRIKAGYKESLLHSLYPVQALLEETELIKKAGLPEIRVSYTKNKDLKTFNGHYTNISILTANIENVDLSLEIREYTNKIKIEFDFYNDHFKYAEIDKLSQFIGSSLREIQFYSAQSTAELNLLSKEEELFSGSDETYPELSEGKTFLNLFQDQVFLNADEAALIYAGIKISYKELNEKSGRFANYLISQGVKKGEYIPVCIDRSEHILIVLLGIIKAGGVYVPIAPGYPVNRTTYMLSDLGARMAISDQSNFLSFNSFPGIICINISNSIKDIEKMPATDPEVNLSPDDLVYIIYTSGTTGEPKGVMVRHDGLLNLLLSMKRYFSFSGNKAMIAVISFNFDMSCTELLLPVVSGGKVIIAGQKALQDGNLLKEKLAYYRPDYMQATPATYQLLVESGWHNEERVELLTGGESVSVQLKNKLLSFPTPKLWNLYGPTEITVFCTIKQLIKDEEITLGHPLTNNHIFILNDSLRFLPVGIPGQIYIGGIQLSNGYLNKPELNSATFINTVIHNKPIRLYKTGDLARWNTHGEIEFLGRADDQIKIRGHRIELSEIETILNRCPDVLNGIVLIKTKDTEKRIVAFVKPVKAFHKIRILSFLRKYLPEYMIPSELLKINVFPVNSSGKIDRKKLLDINYASSSKVLLPQNDIEYFLAETWKSLLKTSVIDLRKDFFETGGHSILLVSLISRIFNKYNVKISFREVYTNSKITKLSKIIEERIGIRSSCKNSIEIPFLKDKIPQKDITSVTNSFLTPFFHYLKYNQAEIFANKGYKLFIPDRSVIQPKVERYIIKNANKIGNELLKVPLHPDKNRLFDSSYLQNSVWKFLQSKGKFANMSFGVHLESPLNFQLLQESFIKLVERHESLRTKFIFDNIALFQLIKSFEKETLSLNCSEYENVEQILAACEEALNHSFDLFDGLPLIKGYFLKETGGSSYLFFVVNHLIFDGFSINIFLKDLFQYYENKHLPPLPFQFKEYVGYNNFYHLMGFDVKDKKYWQKVFAPAYIFYPLAIQNEVVSESTNFMNTVLNHTIIQDELHQLILAYCKKGKCTISTFFLSLYISFIKNNAGTNDILISTNVSNREEGQLNDQIGLYTNSIFLRVNTTFRGSFNKILNAVSAGYLNALQKSKHYTSNQVFDDLGLNEKYGHELLRKYTFNHLYNENSALPESKIKLSSFGLKKEKFGCYYLLLFISEHDDQIDLYIEGNSNFFNQNSIEHVKEQLMKQILEVATILNLN